MPKKGETVRKPEEERWEAHKGYERKIRRGVYRGRVEAGARPAGEDRPFGVYCDAWLSEKKGRVRPSTYVHYEATVEKHIKPRLGDCPARSMSTQRVDAFREDLLAEGRLSVRTVRDILTALRAILLYTAKQFPAGFPTVEVRFPRDEKREMRVLTREEQRRLTAYLQEDLDPCKLGVLLALQTGLRLGELCALRWGDISLEDGTLRVSATMQRLKDSEGEGDSRTRVRLGSPKSDASARTIPLSAGAVRLCQLSGPGPEAAYVLTGEERWMEPRTLQRRMQRYAEACGLEDVTFQTLRDTFAARCVEVGFDLKSLSEILGYASIRAIPEGLLQTSASRKRDSMALLEAAGL